MACREGPGNALVEIPQHRLAYFRNIKRHAREETGNDPRNVTTESGTAGDKSRIEEVTESLRKFHSEKKSRDRNAGLIGQSGRESFHLADISGCGVSLNEARSRSPV